MYKKFVIIFFIIVLVVIVLFYINEIQNSLDWNSDEFYIKESKNNFKINKYLSSLNIEPRKKQRIPKIIHQTSSKDEMDVECYETCLINRYMNPEYEYMFYDNTDVENYISINYPEYKKAFNMLIPGAFKADLFRYLVLYREGGVYIDCKASTVIPLREFISPDIGFVSFRDRPKGSIQISFIASIPGHPILKKCIDMAIHNILNKNYGINMLDITGPQLCGRAFNRLLGTDDMANIEEKTYKEIDADIIGTHKIIGDRRYEALISKNNKIFISRICGSYRKNANFFDFDSYGQRWKYRRVFKD